MNSDSMLWLCLTVVAILTLGEPDLLDSLIVYFNTCK